MEEPNGFISVFLSFEIQMNPFYQFLYIILTDQFSDDGIALFL